MTITNNDLLTVLKGYHTNPAEKSQERDALITAMLRAKANLKQEYKK